MTERRHYPEGQITGALDKLEGICKYCRKPIYGKYDESGFSGWTTDKELEALTCL